jgi:capsule polysaccharide export protein KpsE/RkpR
MESMKDVEQIIRQLPPDLQREVLDFAEFLKQRQANRKQKKLRMSWAGGLREFREKFTALDLQRKALEWWGD